MLEKNCNTKENKLKHFIFQNFPYGFELFLHCFLCQRFKLTLCNSTHNKTWSSLSNAEFCDALERKWNLEYSSDVSPIGGFPAFGKDGGGVGGVGGALRFISSIEAWLLLVSIFPLWKKVFLFGIHKISSEKQKQRHLRSYNKSWCLLFVQFWLWVGSFAAEFDFLTNPLELWRKIQRLWMFQFILFNVAVFLRYP